MSDQGATVSNAMIPSHVPPERVCPYDSAHGPEVMAFPPAALDGLREKRAVFYSTFYGGFWVFTRYEDVRKAFQDHKHFPQHPSGIPQAPYGQKLIPLLLDQPEHIAYKKIMQPIFSPRQMARLEPLIRAFARERLAEFAPKGRIEFASEFALAMSSAMFCGILDLPTAEFPLFHAMSYGLVYEVVNVWKNRGEAAAKALRLKKMQEIQSFITDLVPRRRAAPREDAISILLGSQVFGRPLTDEEVINMGVTLFFAGTDSTAAAVTYAHAFLAEHPEHRQKLIDHIDDGDYVWNASEELLRFHGFHHMARQVPEDCELGGVQLKKGDTIVLPTGSANRDDRQFPDPYSVDLERKNARTHLTFGAGIHRCIGSHLATVQLRVALQEVHRAIPDYRLVSPVVYVSGGPKVVPHEVNFEFTPNSFRA